MHVLVENKCFWEAVKSLHITDVSLGTGTYLHVLQTDKFKCNLISVYIHQYLNEHNVTQNALLPQVLMRGCERWPDQRSIQRKLQSLYGADLSSSVNQWGDMHSISFSLELVDERYVPHQEELFTEGLQLLREVIFQPLTDDGQALRTDYVSQEKANLKRYIESLINDKARYASWRCIEEMFAGTPYALYTYGQVDALPRITARSLFDYYREVVARLPMDIFVVTNKSVEEIAPLVRDAFLRPEPANERSVYAPLELPRGEQKEIIEKKPVQQGKLCLGYRTNVPPADPRYDALTVYNGILGGFVHSKLFRNVREKASLAYYANSRLDGPRGMMLISSGIDPDNYEQALTIIQRQVDDMREGNFDETDLNHTKKSLHNAYRSMMDHSGSLIDRVMYGLMIGQPFQLEQKLQAIEEVTADQVVDVAKNVELDTIYFLTGEEEQS